MQTIGKLNTSVLENEFGILQTNEVVLTEERKMHIKERHPLDYVYIEKYGADTVNNPDIIFKDNKHESTALLIKKLPNTNLNVVVRLAVGVDDKHPKNSIMTCHRVRDSFLNKMLKRHKILYSR